MEITLMENETHKWLFTMENSSSGDINTIFKEPDSHLISKNHISIMNSNKM